MKPKRHPWIETLLEHHPDSTLYIQAPLPDCLHTLPKLITITGQGSGRQGPPPLASAEPSPNE